MEKIIRLESNSDARMLFGTHDKNIKAIERELNVKLALRDGYLKVTGAPANIKKASGVIECMLDPQHRKENENRTGVRMSGGKPIEPKTKGQREYVEAIKNNDIVFGIGPAGTGKTYLAMAAAVESLRSQEVRRIILTRPAIEAGESLGFLPGDMYEKISPYLRPLYDALYDMMEGERIERYIETGIIEVAPEPYAEGVRVRR